MSRGFTIEKLFQADALTFLYRLGVDVLGRHFQTQVMVARESGVEEKKAAIHSAVCNLLQGIERNLLEEADRIYAQTGDYDTTGLGIHDPETSAMEVEYRRQRQIAQYEQRYDQRAVMQAQAALNRNVNLMLEQIYGRGPTIPLPRAGEWREVLWGEGGIKQSEKDRRAMSLLAKKIGFRRMRQLKKKGYFEEQGKHGIFRFHMDTQGGVSLIERKKYGSTEREVVWTLCVQSLAADLPKGDVILSRWMEWKADEDKFLDTANFRSIRTRDEAIQGRV